MRRNKSEKLNCIKTMPPLRHSIPGYDFDIRNSEVVNWLIQQPDILQWLMQNARNTGFLIYDPLSGLWRGCDYDA